MAKTDAAATGSKLAAMEVNNAFKQFIDFRIGRNQSNCVDRSCPPYKGENTITVFAMEWQEVFLLQSFHHRLSRG
jgi:hypothetical protein